MYKSMYYLQRLPKEGNSLADKPETSAILIADLVSVNLNYELHVQKNIIS
jgi:hypothetical protein